MSLKKKIAAAVVGLGLTASGLAFAATPAEAVTTFKQHCNSSGSDDGIVAYNVDSPYTLTQYLNPGNCFSGGNIPVSKERVDVDPSGNVDIDSHKIGHINYGYGPCYASEPNASNPPDSYADTGYRYYTSTGSSC